jgi:hypothetical protein
MSKTATKNCNVNYIIGLTSFRVCQLHLTIQIEGEAMSEGGGQSDLFSRAAVTLPISGPWSSRKVASNQFQYHTVIDEICELGWANLGRHNLLNVAWVYYFFSVQFRENLEIACDLYPDDVKLQQLKLEECDTENLSPWPGVVNPGERINHDEFVRRLLTLSPISVRRRKRLEEIGRRYLTTVRQIDVIVRASSIASYEDGGLARVFRAILECKHWDNPSLQAFRHFLTAHVRFDEDVEHGHATLCRHLGLDDQILPLWVAFRSILIEAAPRSSI